MTNLSKLPQVEYVGFHYYIVIDEDGAGASAIVMENQHRSAGKDKHRRAAVMQYNQERK